MSDSPTIWFDRRPARELAELAPAKANIEWPESEDPLDGIDRADGVIAGAAIIYDRAVFARATQLRVLVRAGI